MIDFRRPRPDGTTGYEVDDEGVPINDLHWPNVEGGNVPAWIWRPFMLQSSPPTECTS